MSASKQPKPFSVAAFLFMPQFRLSMQGFAHIVPVMMRTIAMLFEQTGLIARNHPATRYGIEGVRKYSFFELMGEAWFTLRTTRALPYQWASFSAIIMMILMVIALVSTFFLRVVVGLGSSAQAQIFDNAYVVGGTNTAAATSAGTTMFDKAGPPGGASTDLAIMLLDKMLRQGAGVGQASAQGGSLQQALGAFFQIYNTGVLVIAGIMLFWLVLSVVVDTAKTGVIGGGRHNMVWAPIRIVFALGLMIPLGATGFSSGQYMVMKLAEWGSNFGTNAWVAYVGAVANSTDMIVDPAPVNPTQVVSAFTRMWVCRVAMNAEEYARVGVFATLSPQRITQVNANLINWGSGAYAFTNRVSPNLCGSVSYQTPGRNPATMLSNAPGTTANPIGTPYPTSDPAGVLSDAINTATMTYMNTTLAPQSKSIACQFAQEFNLGQSAIDVGECAASDASFAGCPASGTGIATRQDGTKPDQACIATMVDGMRTAMNTASTNARNTLSGTLSGPALLNYVRQQGWAGMGIWYHQISSMNRAVLGLSDPRVTVSNGTFSEGTSEKDITVIKIIDSYDAWWASYTPAAILTPALNPANPAQMAVAGATTVGTPSLDSQKLVEGVNPQGMDSKGASAMISDVLVKSMDAPFYIDIVNANNSNTYPLAELAKIGDKLMAWGTGIVAVISIIESVAYSMCESAKTAANSWVPGSTAVSTLISIGSCFTAKLFGGGLAGLFIMIGKTMVTTGIMLSYYVPILPFIRVSFAVLTWMISVFEAVLMVPIAALAHLTTEGEGIAGGGRTAWILWLNVLMRPVLTVGGYIAALLIFNSFVVYFHMVFGAAVTTGMQGTGMSGIFSNLFYSIVYGGVIYTVANTCFKLLDLMPNAMMRWIGGSADQSFDNDSAAEGFISAAGSMLSRSGVHKQRQFSKKGSSSPGVST